MNTYGNHLLACSGRGLRLCNSSKSKTMTLNLIARKNLFRLSEGFFSLAQKSERSGFMTLSKMFVIAWERCLDLRDRLR
jgi:hypothetical protein